MDPRDLPSIHSLLEHGSFGVFINRYGRDHIKMLCQDALELMRQNINDEENTGNLIDRVLAYVARNVSPRFRRVINATGTVLHTNLGRAPLPEHAIRAISQTAQAYSNLEFNLDLGHRGHRSDHLNDLLVKLTGAEAGFAVNNNAGAVMLALASIAQGREVIVSRGELIEIGGGFRIPDVMTASGAILKEVGTTNRTHLKDYQSALNEHTGLIFKAHWSNFTMSGFTHSVTVNDLMEIGRSHSIPVMYDLGSGCMIDGSAFGWHTITVSESIRMGLDLVTFSGDKLLGGPQAGILCGRKDIIAKAAAHPLARALRIDKLSLAALESTLRLYLEPRRAWADIPVLRMLSQSESELRTRVKRWRKRLKISNEQLSVTVHRDMALVGGGALPGIMLPTCGVILKSNRFSSAKLLSLLRAAPIPIIARIKDNEVFLDFRTIQIQEEADLIVVLKSLIKD